MLVALSFMWLADFTSAIRQHYRCIPGDGCSPSPHDWDSFNHTISGQLIKSLPIAASCYAGPSFDAAACAAVDAEWTNPRFRALSPVGLDYPINVTCSPLNLTIDHTANKRCTLGSNPYYAVNATSLLHVSGAVGFARRKNLRLVIKTTGHDLLGRSDGVGSLEIWLKHLRTGVSFTKTYNHRCSEWTGSAITVGGGYTWDDVYPVARNHNVVVVGGGTPSVGVLGGWMQGGGHGPASREFGLGADQVLSAEVVLANGSIVTASPCEHPERFFAIRGGESGTYGVVTKTVIKAWPMVDVSVQHLAIAPLTGNVSTLLDAVTTLYHDFPNLNDAGYAGYGTWSIDSPAPLFADFTAGYVHGTYMFNKSVAYARAAFQPTLEKLLPYNGTTLFISVTCLSYADYWSFYFAESGVESPAGSAGALGSRLFSRKAVQSNEVGLRVMVDAVAGKAGEQAVNAMELVSGGAVFADESDVCSGLNPAWRKSYFNNIVSRGLALNASQDTINQIWADVQAKTAAMKTQAPDTGAYMNEASWLDPDWENDFYGSHYERLLGIKEEYDPLGVFYCPTCVGSAEWREDRDDRMGRLCRIRHR